MNFHLRFEWGLFKYVATAWDEKFVVSVECSPEVFERNSFRVLALLAKALANAYEDESRINTHRA